MDELSAEILRVRAELDACGKTLMASEGSRGAVERVLAEKMQLLDSDRAAWDSGRAELEGLVLNLKGHLRTGGLMISNMSDDREMKDSELAQARLMVKELESQVVDLSASVARVKSVVFTRARALVCQLQEDARARLDSAVEMLDKRDEEIAWLTQLTVEAESTNCARQKHADEEREALERMLFDLEAVREAEAEIHAADLEILAAQLEEKEAQNQMCKKKLIEVDTLADFCRDTLCELVHQVESMKTVVLAKAQLVIAQEREAANVHVGEMADEIERHVEEIGILKRQLEDCDSERITA